MRADLLREYGVDLDDALDGGLRPTALADLAVNLSPSASVWREIEPDVIWGLPEALLALLVDEIRAYRYEFGKVNRFRGMGRPPEPIERPGVKPQTEVDTIGKGEGFDTIEDFEAWYEGVKAGHRSAATG